MAPVLRRMRRGVVARTIVSLRLPPRAWETVNELVFATGLNASQLVTLVIRTAARDRRAGKATRLVVALRAAASSAPELGAKSVKTSFNLSPATSADLRELADEHSLSEATALAVMLDAIAAAYGGGGNGGKPLGSGDMDLDALVYIIHNIHVPPAPLLLRGSEAGEAGGVEGDLSAA